VSEVITHGSDGLVLEDPGDAEALASMIEDLYKDVSLRQKLGANASSTAMNYTWDLNAEQLRAVMEEILSARSGAEGCPTAARC